MNRYEALGAPPTLSSKDMSMHIKMLPSAALSAELRTQYSGDLLKPKVRLYDELKTLRFPPRPGAEEKNELYSSACKKLAHASGEPIPYRFFKSQFQRLLEDCGYSENSSPSELNETTLNNAVGSTRDIWQFQAYAALLLRIAENSELSDSKNAHRAWHAALNAYQRFFAEAKVEESCAYKAQTEEKFKQDCRDAWNVFLAEQVEGVYQRMKRYIQQNNAEGVTACMQILQLGQVKSINPDLYAKAMEDSLIPYAKSIQSASSLKTAGEMYSNCPKELLAQDESGECKRAMLGALKNAVEQLSSGGAKIDEIIKWANTLDVVALYQNGKGLIKKGAEDFYNACAKFIRDMVANNQFDMTKALELLVTILPADFVIAKTNEKDLKQAEMLGYGVLNYISETMDAEEFGKYSEADARSFGEKLKQFVDNNIPKGKFREQTLGEVSKYIVVRLQQSLPNGALFQASLEAFPDSWPIDQPEFPNFQILRSKLFGSPLVKQALNLLKEAKAAATGSYDEEKKIRALIEFACDHPELDLEQPGVIFADLVDNVLIQAFVSNFNRYTDNHYDSQAKDTIQVCGSFLPSDTDLPSGSKNKMTTDMLMMIASIDKDVELGFQRLRYDINHRARREKELHGFDNGLHNENETPLPLSQMVGRQTNNSQTPDVLLGSNKKKKKRLHRHLENRGYSGRSRKKTKTFTKLNGIRFRGGNAAAGIQYFLWMLILPALGVFGIDTLMTRAQTSTQFFTLISTAFLCFWAVLLLNGIFGLLANSSNKKASGFGKAARVFVWMAALLVVLAVASGSIWPDNRFLRVLLGAWSIILLSTTFQQIDKNAYYRTSTMTIDAFTFHGGGIAVFFKYIVVQLYIPFIVASMVYIFGWRLSPGWIFVFKLYGLLMLIGILRVFFTCLAEESGVKRFATFMAAEIYMLTLPAAGWFTLKYFDAFPLKWWVITLYVIYGIFFLIGTIAATQVKD